MPPRGESEVKMVKVLYSCVMMLITVLKPPTQASFLSSVPAEKMLVFLGFKCRLMIFFFLLQWLDCEPGAETPTLFLKKKFPTHTRIESIQNIWFMYVAVTSFSFWYNMLQNIPGLRRVLGKFIRFSAKIWINKRSNVFGKELKCPSVAACGKFDRLFQPQCCPLSVTVTLLLRLKSTRSPY